MVAACDCVVKGRVGFDTHGCSCEAYFVPCPAHTSGHPNCAPDVGYTGVVIWHDDTEVYEVRDLTFVDCGELGENHPDCRCIAYYVGKFEPWDAKKPGWRNNCTLAKCPPGGRSFPKCECVEGFAETAPLVWDTPNQSWGGECAKVSCPANAVQASHPQCNCAQGYKGAYTWNAGTDSFDGSCSLAPCPLTSSPVQASVGSKCRCDLGYFESPENPLAWVTDTQQWRGSCRPRSCPLFSSGHPNCVCNKGYFGVLTFDFVTGTYVGNCSVAPCPSHAVGSGCDCDTGYTGNPEWNSEKQKWVHKCTAKGCPTGSNSTDLSKCECNKAGYVGALSWSGTEWSACKIVDCPPGTDFDGQTDGDRLCSCGGWGRTGIVRWSTTLRNWLPECRDAACAPDSTCDVSTQSAQCAKGFQGHIDWNNATESWDSTCKPTTCPGGSDGFPDCACSTGYSGGSELTAQLVWDFEKQKFRGLCATRSTSSATTKVTCEGEQQAIDCGAGTIKITQALFGRETDDSSTCVAQRGASITGCLSDTTAAVVRTRCEGKSNCLVPASKDEFGDPCQDTDKYLKITFSCVGVTESPCEEMCKEIACPEHANKVGSKCNCDNGYEGTIDWKRPTYVGTCKEAPCPLNATGSGPRCACPDGYLPSPNFGFAGQAWHGQCTYIDCPTHSHGWPSCVCDSGYISQEPIKFDGGFGGRGYIGSCIDKECPTNAETPGVCTCKKGFATFVEGSKIDGPRWDADHGNWLHSCISESCPFASDGHPDCMCKDGYKGSPNWNPAAGTWSACPEVACPGTRHMVKATPQNAPWYKSNLHQCTCEVGFAGSITFDSNNDVWLGSCTETRCPPNAKCDPIAPECAKGFAGAVTWTGETFANNEWQSTCKAVNCPENAVNHPNCECKPGYSGGVLTFLNGQWTTSCTAVPCPAHSSRLESGHCSCDAGYSGHLDWVLAENSFKGECKVVPCVGNATGEPECECINGFKPTGDFAFSKQSQTWVGACDSIPCPLNAKRMDLSNCQCEFGFQGTISYSIPDRAFVGECKEVICPNGNAPPLCSCPIGFAGISVWTGAGFQDTECIKVPCPTGTHQVDLTKGFTCKCDALTKGVPKFAATQWDAECEVITPPSNSKSDPNDPLKRICDDGFKGHPVWNVDAMRYDGVCVPIQCVAPTIGLGGPKGCKCDIGYVGKCVLDRPNQEFDCDCAALSCPPNAFKIDDDSLCTCSKGFFGKLTWSDDRADYDGSCTKRKCEDVIPNSSGHPNCACDPGYAGQVTWDPVGQTYNGKCSFVACPAFTANHPTCSLDSGYKFVGSNPVTWTGSEFKGSAELIPCPAHATGGPNCACNTGYSNNGMHLENLEYVGSCELVPCPAGHEGTGHPNCACAKGFSGSITWENNQWTSTCKLVPCPAHASGDQVCKCDDGFAGTPTWDSKSQAWTHTCEQVFCPPNSKGHPACQCLSGFTGSIHWAAATFEYIGTCTIVPCPKGSRRRDGLIDAAGPVKFLTTDQLTETGVYEVKTVVGDFDAYIEVVGGEAWVKVAQWETSYKPTTREFGSIATVNKGTGKLADEHINQLSDISTHRKLYRIDWAGPGRNNKNSLYIDTTLPHSDGSASFGIIGAGTRAIMASRTPSTGASWSTYSVNQIAGQLSDPTLAGTGCDQAFMGVTIKGDATFDCIHSESERCLHGASGCKDSAGSDNAELQSVQVFVRLDRKLNMFPDFDSAELKAANGVNTIPSCECFVGCAGGYDWVNTDYRGSCLCSDCPGDCSALKSNPATTVVAFPPTKGYAGHVLWDGSEWVDNSVKVDCPVNSHGHPDCKCDPGFSGSVTYHGDYNETTHHQTVTYASSCSFVACPSTQMARSIDSSGAPHCACTVGSRGIAVWNADTQSFGGDQECTSVPCSDKLMDRSDDLTTCTCPVNFAGREVWNDARQKYGGDEKCRLVECPTGAVCNSDPSERKCQIFFTGSYHWDAKNQAWSHNCAPASCPANSKSTLDHADENGGCVCLLGFSPDPTWNADSQAFSGCFQLADCPQNSNLAIQTSTGGRRCDCLPGFRHQPKWIEANATFIHSCDQATCPTGSVRGSDKLCQCKIGFKGALSWNTLNEAYDGACEVAPCPDSAGSDCSTSTTPEQRSAVTQLPCKKFFFGSTNWNATSQSWVNGCARRSCPTSAGVFTTDSLSCRCKWGFGGAVVWDENSQDYVSKCQAMSCSSPSSASSSGSFCLCPRATLNGVTQFLDDDVWSANCSAVAACPAQASGVGDGDCKCNQGYRGLLSFDTESTVDDTGETLRIQQATTRTGSCTKVECPDPALPNSHPNCRCAPGYAGSITWDDAGQKYVSTCKLVSCPGNASGAPDCACSKGYLGTVAFNMTSQGWVGSCSLADCPKNTFLAIKDDVPACPCQKGFKGVQKFEFGTGWTHTCELVDCPALSSKVQNNAVMYQVIPGFIGCHDTAGTNLGLAGSPKDYLSDVTTNCLDADETCINIAKRACEAMIDQGKDCFGFTMAAGKRIQMLDTRAMNSQICDAETGLMPNPDFTVYKRRASKGDCLCSPGYAGGFVFVNEQYVGKCTLDACPANADCTETVRCKQGFSGAASFSWDYDQEKWNGACKAVTCPANDDPKSHPNCKCDVGYKGSHTWDLPKEQWTGTCTKVDCVTNSDANFPTCKCANGFCRNDGAGNQVIQWNGTAWLQTCESIACPAKSKKLAGANCKCDTGYRGVISYTPDTCVYSVAKSDELRSCTRVPCPDNAHELFDQHTGLPMCKCNPGFTGAIADIMVWDSVNFEWGTCQAVPCPPNSEGHPHCTCKLGFSGSISWAGGKFTGSCTESSQTNTWEEVNPATTAISCHLLRGATSTSATAATGSIDFSFAGGADTINVLRCDMTLDSEFTKIVGSFVLKPTTSGAPVRNNIEIVNYNSTSLTTAVGYVAFGTRHTIIDAGKEMGKTSAIYDKDHLFTIPETPVTQTNVVRFELAQPSGVGCTISDLKFQTYNVPADLVKCVRVITETASPADDAAPVDTEEI
eukprot:c20758_g2_i2.p1 GENE.c20758_g2_i2~~c20758_g2_i2.p1  ORF type:complete len:3096 (-),score=514.29 c20758_g2_i2:57-9083(-)